MTKTLRGLLTGLICTLVIFAVGATLIIVTTAPQAPPPMAAVESAVPTLITYGKEAPSAQFFSARDGSTLAYRHYAGEAGKGVVVLVHGSSGSSLAVHGIARALAAQGITVYAPDLRGHGQSPGPDGRIGDVAYRGQYEDDLADLSAHIAKTHPGEKRLLAGHSMGGAVTLRTASLSGYAQGYDAYLGIAPFIAPGSVMDRPNQGGWTRVSVPRIIVLSLLNSFGISVFDHLPVLAMPVPEDDAKRGRPGTYSHALLASANLPRQWQPSIAAIGQPTRILIGAGDEMFVAEAYPQTISEVNPAINVTLIPGVGHMSVLYAPEALTAITTTVQEMLR